jgi:exosortase
VRFLSVAALGASLAWAYWPTFVDVAERWAHEPQYSHGYLVPLFAVFLLWHRRQLSPAAAKGSAWGLPAVCAGVALSLAGAYFHFPWLEAVSLLPCLAGLVLLAGGGAALRWAWPAIAFLLFMFALPFRIEVSLAQPLQWLATQASTAALVLLGFTATAEGNIITLGESQVGVAEACNGLSMLLTFVALAVACATVIKRPARDRVVLVLSAVPIALFANVVRITVTGILYETADPGLARAFFHDFAGWFMMVLALGLVWIELQILARLFVEQESGPLRLQIATS